MKKKLALLLVLSLVLSMIPVTAFGADITARVIGNPLLITEEAYDGLSRTIRLPLNQFSDFTSPNAVRLLLTLGDAQWLSQSAVSIVTSPTGTLTCSAIAENELGGGDAYLLTFSHISSAPPSYETEFIDFTVAFDVGANDKAAKLNIQQLQPADGQQIVALSGSLALTQRLKPGLTVTAGDVKTFRDKVTINPIKIKEDRAGSIQPSQELLITLTIKGSFEWGSTQDAAVKNGDGFLTGFTPGTPAVTKETDSTTVITAALETGSSSLAAGEIAIEGLIIVPGTKAKYGSDVTINVLVTQDGKELAKKEGLVVAKYADFSLSVARAGDDPAALTSGAKAARTSAIRLEEKTPGSFNVNRRGEISFRFDAPEGVKIVNAQVATNDAGDDWGSGGFNITDIDYVIFADETQRDPAKTYKYHVRFDINIEPGYEAAYGNDVVFTVGGASLDKDYLITIAEVEDAVDVSVERVEGPAVSGQGIFEIGEITITERKAGVLAEDSEIWIYVESPSFNNEITLDTRASGVSRPAAANLEVSRFDRLTIEGLPQGVSFTITAASEDEPGEIVIPAATISGFFFAGAEYRIIVSGDAVAASSEFVEYVSENQHTSIAAFRREGYAAEFFESAYAAPIFGEAAEKPGATDPSEEPGETDPDETDPGTDPGAAEPGITLKPFSFKPGETAYTTLDGQKIDPAFIATEAGVGYFAVRVLADMVGADVGLLTGNAGAWIDNGTLRVEMLFGSSTARVFENGVFVNAVEMAAGENGEVSAPCLLSSDNRTYLPARFLATLYGYAVSFADGEAAFVPAK